MKILVTGSSGLLGSKILEICTNHQIFPTYNSHSINNSQAIKLDIQNKTEVANTLTKIKPDTVIHCAALSDVDKCEKNKEQARSINIEGTRNIAEAVKKLNASLIYVSTDYVFSGDKGDYTEEDSTNPINYYGYTKLEAEKIVKASVKNWAIARPSVIYGSTPAAGKINFTLWLIEKLSINENVNIIKDQIISPTLNTNLAEMILEVAEKGLTGLYHLAGATQLTRVDFAYKIAEEFDLNKKLINSVTSNEMNWAAKRPMNSSLNVKKASNKLKTKPLQITEALKKLKKELGD